MLYPVPPSLPSFPRLVQEEIGRLADGADVYKLIGPVLVKQDLGEVKTNVKNRLALITKEVERNDKAIQGKDKEQEAIREKVMQMQQARQKAAAAAQ